MKINVKSADVYKGSDALYRLYNALKSIRKSALSAVIQRVMPYHSGSLLRWQQVHEYQNNHSIWLIMLMTPTSTS
jgi:hypothetical protein